MAGQQLDAALGAAGRPRLAGSLPYVGDRGDLDTGVGEVERRGVRAVVGGEHDRPRPRKHAVVIRVGAGRAGQHHAGQVVPGEGDEPLVAAGGQHHTPGPDAPDALARHVGGGRRAQVVGPALHRDDVVVVVVADDRGAAQHAYVRQGGQRGDLLGRPLAAGRAVERLGRAEEAAARLGPLVGEDHPRTGPRRHARGGDAGRSRADHEHVAVGVHRVVTRRVGPVGQPALSRQAGGDQAVVQLDGRGGEHRLGEGLLDLDERVRLLAARGVDAARTAELDAARHRAHAVGEQRRGQRVALKALVVAAVEPEAQRRARRPLATVRLTGPAGLLASLAHALTGRGSPTR